MLSLKSKHEEWTSCLLTICLNVISFSWYLLVFTPSHLPAIDEAQKESNKRGELERSPNKRREVAPVWGPQFWLDGFWYSEMPVECSPWWWFQIFCIFTPTWRNDPIWRILYFSNGLRPPTSHPSTVRRCFILAEFLPSSPTLGIILQQQLSFHQSISHSLACWG